MKNFILLQGGRVIDPANNIDAVGDVLVEDGKIAQVGTGILSNLSGEQKENLTIIDAVNKVITPGFIDLHAHLREPGREDKETIATASRSAAKGGITSIVAMPNTAPIADNQTVLEYLLSKAKKDAVVNVYAAGAITKGQGGKEIAEIWEMKNTGAIALSDDGFDIQNLDVYLKALQYCKTHDMLIISHTEDKNLAEGGHMHEGKVSSRLGLKGIPACAEDTATARLICLVEEAQHRFHFTHVTTQGSIDLIRLAKSKGLPVTADVTPHHLALTDEAVENYNTHAKVNPPLRSENHRQALIKALQENVVDVIATDHAPHLWTEKEREFDKAPVGVVGFETLLSVIITYLVQPGVLSLSAAIAKITSNPARVLKIAKGTLSAGADADITVFDPNAEVTIDRTKFISKGQNSPFHGMTLKGVVTETLVQGKIVVKNGEVVEN